MVIHIKCTGNADPLCWQICSGKYGLEKTNAERRVYKMPPGAEKFDMFSIFMVW